MFNAVNEADRYFMRILCTSFVLVHIILLGVKANSVANSPCGGVLNQSQGFIQTPNFPGKFKVPIKCKWVIDASSHLPNATLTVHLTQLYVTTGLRFTGLPYYDPENTFALGEKFGESPVHNVSENNVLTVNWLKTDSQFLAVYFELNQLEGNHIRALDNLLDVYGFNITYQVRNGLVGANSTCSAVGCSYNGHCFASHNYSEYRCSCFHGFSGKDCGQGPLCRSDRNPCMNNGTCRHVGSSSVICNCPASYTGSKCEIAVQLPSSDCPEDGGKKTECVNYCPVRQHESPCSCRLRPVKEVSERSRYQIGIQTTSESMENSSSRDHLKPISSRTSSHQFEKSITKYLKGRISSFEALKILNISFDGEILFHVFARNEDEDNIKQSIGEMVEQAALDNFTFTSATFNFKREPALFVEEVSVSPDRRSVRHGDEFIITCTAYGSQHITFRWFKNDILINITKATREMSIIDAPNHLLDHYTSMLTVKSADPLDRGLYTCQAIDWGAQHCKSVKLDVISAPGVKVAPLTASIQKGQALNIICTWSMTSDDSKLFYGYSWLKERKDTSEAHLFKMKEDSEVWEDLQPVGSILRVYNIQKSTRYTCQVQSNAEPVEASVDVEVLNKSAIPWCESDDTGVGGVRWAEIGAWGAAKVECPARYSGVATRLCSVSAPGKAAWLTPDYSNCISEDLSRLAENFKKSTLGYGSTTGAYTMSKIYELLRDRSRLYPGEGETFLTLMQDVAWYLNFTMAWKDLLQSTPAFYNTINIILQHSNSIINSQKLIDLQNLVNHWTITWAKHSRINRASVQSYDSLMIHTYCFNSSSNKLEYTFDVSGNIRGYQSWSRTAVNILVARESLLVHGSTYSIAIIIYKDLMKYLPERQIYKMDDGSEWEVEQTSGNVVSLVGSSPSLQVMVDIRMATALRQGWNMSCGAMTAPSARWMLEKCTVTIDIEASVTRCTCPMLATITALLTKTALQNGKKSTAKSDVVLILGCLCCILQCVLSTALLLMRWYNNPSCLIFLKLQCCISVTAIAMVFFSAARSDMKESSYPVFVFSLEAFFLLGLSSHLTKLLLVYTEIIYLPTVKDMKLTVVGVINGFTLLIVLCNHLSYNSTRWRMESWWLIKGTFVFYAFVICISVMSAMFLFLYLSVMKRLAQLSSMKSISKEQTKAIKKRVCLLGRAALLFITILVMALMSIVYVNYPGLKSQYAFSLTCAFTGFVLLACYVLQSEAPLHLHLMEKIGAKDVCTSDSESNILNFFTKQDGETESECAPPQPSKEPPTCQKESIQLREISPRGLSPLSKEKATSNTKLVTFQSDLVQGCEVLKYASTLPKRRPKLTITRSESISNISGITSLDQFGNEHHVTTSSTHRSLDVGLLQSNHDVLTTRVCVELGLVTNGDKHHTINEGPSIVLCSVDIEPCPGKVVELNEVTVKTTTTDVNGNGSSNSLTVANMNISRQTQNVCSNRAFENNLSQLDNENGNCIESVQEASRTDRDVLNRISSDLQYLLQDYDANGNANNKTVQGEQGIIVRSSVEDDKNEENCSEGKTSL